MYIMWGSCRRAIIRIVSRRGSELRIVKVDFRGVTCRDVVGNKSVRFTTSILTSSTVWLRCRFSVARFLNSALASAFLQVRQKALWKTRQPRNGSQYQPLEEDRSILFSMSPCSHNQQQALHLGSESSSPKSQLQ